jgi:hypothetical protein
MKDEHKWQQMENEFRHQSFDPIKFPYFMKFFYLGKNIWEGSSVNALLAQKQTNLKRGR